MQQPSQLTGRASHHLNRHHTSSSRSNWIVVTTKAPAFANSDGEKEIAAFLLSTPASCWLILTCEEQISVCKNIYTVPLLQMSLQIAKK